MQTRTYPFSRPAQWTFAGLFGLGLVLRLAGLGWLSLDATAFLLPWYNYIVERGLAESLRQPFTNYTPFYTYLLMLASFSRGILAPLTAIKLISIVFDILLAALTYKIVRLTSTPQRALGASALLFLLPSGILNSAWWGQADSIYATFTLASLYFLLKQQPMHSLAAFGAALAIKLQAIFFAPVLLALTLRKKLPVLGFLSLPLMYFLLALPTLLAGRPALDVFSIYLRQGETYPDWSLLAPNPYLFVSAAPIPANLLIFLLAACALFAIWISLTSRFTPLTRPSGLILAALVSVSLAPYLLPRMHERYFYLQDLLSLITAFHFPQLWILPILSQAASLLSYSIFLCDINPACLFVSATPVSKLILAFALETMLIALALRTQQRLSNPT